MKVSREKVAENRRAILTAAGRLFRERGFEAVTVAEVMKAAGLTHGGFYGYFSSKEDLIAQTMADIYESAPLEQTLSQYSSMYLAPEHRAKVAEGCAVAALGGEVRRQSEPARAAMTEALRQQLKRLAAVAPGSTAKQRRRAAIGSWSAMVGALTLARLCDDEALADEVLKETKAFLVERGKARE